MACVEVVIPDGLYAGDAFTVSHEGSDFDVVVPDGCSGGMLLTVDVPPPPGAAAEVEVPAGLVPGDQFLMSTADGLELDVVVPDGCYGGDVILVDLPPPEETMYNRERRPSLGRRPSANDGRRPSASEGVRRTSNNGAGGSSSSSGRNRGSGGRDGWPGSTKGQGAAPGASTSSYAAPTNGEKKGIKLNLNLGNGLSLNLDLCTQGKFRVGSQVEVYRTDGSWSRAQVKVSARVVAMHGERASPAAGGRRIALRVCDARIPALPR